MYTQASEKLVATKNLHTLHVVYIMLFMNYIYSTDLETEYLMHLQKLPKSELHLHLSGSYPKKHLYSIASPEQRVNLETALMHVAQRIDYHQVFAVFQSVSQIINTEEKVEQGVKALCDSLKEDGVAYVEIRSGLKNLGRGAEAYLNAILDGIRAENSPCFEACLLLSLQRNSTAHKNLRKYMQTALFS